MPVVELAISGSSPSGSHRIKATQSSMPDAFSGLPPDSTRLVAVPLCDGMDPSISPDGRSVGLAVGERRARVRHSVWNDSPHLPRSESVRDRVEPVGVVSSPLQLR